MSTKATLQHHQSTDGDLAWHLYEDAFEDGVVYSEIERVNVELTTDGGADLLLELPVTAAKQLGLLAKRQFLKRSQPKHTLEQGVEVLVAQQRADKQKRG